MIAARRRRTRASAPTATTAIAPPTAATFCFRSCRSFFFGGTLAFTKSGAGVSRLEGRRDLPVLEELGVPPLSRELASARTGLVLVGGATSSGKTTTLAAFIDDIHRTQHRHVISLENPIEIQHMPKMALVQQREVTNHTRSFARALRSALRQAPDVIVIGEMRDKETIELALTAEQVRFSAP